MVAIDDGNFHEMVQGDDVAAGEVQGLLEGPVWLGDRLIFTHLRFSTGNPSELLQFTPPSTFEVLYTNMGLNGLAMRTDGSIVGASHLVGGLVDVDLATGATTTIIAEYNGARLNSPNDLAIRSDGNIYFSDPTWQAPTPRPQGEIYRVFRLDPAGNLTVVDESTLPEPETGSESGSESSSSSGDSGGDTEGECDTSSSSDAGSTGSESGSSTGGADTDATPELEPNQSNGVALSPAEDVLYVGDLNGVWVYAVADDGSVATPGALIEGVAGGVDGMAVDCAGNLYVTNHGAGEITVVSPALEIIGTITVRPSLTNVAFGGPDGTTLYATAGDPKDGTASTLYSLELAIPGSPY